MRKLLYYLGLSCIMLVIFILHSAFQYALNPIFLAGKFYKNLFVLSNGFDLKTYFPYAFGLAFSIAIGAIIDLLNKKDPYFWRFVWTVSIMELIEVALLFYPDHNWVWQKISGVYYGIYFLLAIVFYSYVKPEDDDSQNLPNDSHDNSQTKNDSLYLPNKSNENSHDSQNNLIDSHENSQNRIDKEKIKTMYLVDKKTPMQIIRELHIPQSSVYRVINSLKQES